MAPVVPLLLLLLLALLAPHTPYAVAGSTLASWPDDSSIIAGEPFTDSISRKPFSSTSYILSLDRLAVDAPNDTLWGIDLTRRILVTLSIERLGLEYGYNVSGALDPIGLAIDPARSLLFVADAASGAIVSCATSSPDQVMEVASIGPGYNRDVPVTVDPLQELVYWAVGPRVYYTAYTSTRHSANVSHFDLVPEANILSFGVDGIQRRIAWSDEVSNTVHAGGFDGSIVHSWSVVKVGTLVYDTLSQVIYFADIDNGYVFLAPFSGWQDKVVAFTAYYNRGARRRLVSTGNPLGGIALYQPWRQPPPVEALHRSYALVCGDNSMGVLGIGPGSPTMPSPYVPVEAPTVFTNPGQGPTEPAPLVQLGTPVAADIGGCHALFVAASGLVYASGCDTHGQLGQGLAGAPASDYGTTVPRLVPGISTAIAVAAGEKHSVALLQNGDAVAWGLNSMFQLCNPAVTAYTRTSPQPVAPPTAWTSANVTITAIAAAGDRTVLVGSNGEVALCGERAWTYTDHEVGGSRAGVIMMPPMPGGRALRDASKDPMMPSLSQPTVTLSISNSAGAVVLDYGRIGAYVAAWGWDMHQRDRAFDDECGYGCSIDDYLQQTARRRLDSTPPEHITVTGPMGGVPVALDLSTTDDDDGISERPVAVAAGEFFVLVLLDSGRVLGTGSNVGGQLGRPPSELLYTNQTVEVLAASHGGDEEPDRRVGLAAGRHTAFLWTESGEVLSWGNGTGRCLSNTTILEAGMTGHDHDLYAPTFPATVHASAAATRVVTNGASTLVLAPWLCGSEDCPSGYWRSERCTTESRGVCSPCSTTCPQGQWLSRPCGGSMDTCGPCSQCAASQYEAQPCKGGRDRVCAAATKCPKGSYQVSAATASRNTVCAQCTPPSACPEGTYAATACTATSDTQCLLCSDACPSGSTLVTPCSSTSDLVCVPGLAVQTVVEVPQFKRSDNAGTTMTAVSASSIAVAGVASAALVGVGGGGVSSGAVMAALDAIVPFVLEVQSVGKLGLIVPLDASPLYTGFLQGHMWSLLAIRIGPLADASVAWAEAMDGRPQGGSTVASSASGETNIIVDTPQQQQQQQSVRRLSTSVVTRLNASSSVAVHSTAFGKAAVFLAVAVGVPPTAVLHYIILLIAMGLLLIVLLEALAAIIVALKPCKRRCKTLRYTVRGLAVRLWQLSFFATAIVAMAEVAMAASGARLAASAAVAALWLVAWNVVLLVMGFVIVHRRVGSGHWSVRRVNRRSRHQLKDQGDKLEQEDYAKFLLVSEQDARAETHGTPGDRLWGTLYTGTRRRTSWVPLGQKAALLLEAFFTVVFAHVPIVATCGLITVGLLRVYVIMMLDVYSCRVRSALERVLAWLRMCELLLLVIILVAAGSGFPSSDSVPTGVVVVAVAVHSVSNAVAVARAMHSLWKRLRPRHKAALQRCMPCCTCCGGQHQGSESPDKYKSAPSASDGGRASISNAGGPRMSQARLQVAGRGSAVSTLNPMFVTLERGESEGGGSGGQARSGGGGGGVGGLGASGLGERSEPSGEDDGFELVLM